jgi:hypothetical protein
MVARIYGVIRYTGGEYVDDKRERLEIWVDKKDAGGLPYQDHKRVDINLFVGNSKYRSGLRSKPPKTPYVWICPDLRDTNSQKVSLARVLDENGFRKNDRVVLIVNGKDIRLEREL